MFLDACYLIYLRYAEDDEIYSYCIELFKKFDEYEPVTDVLVFNEVIWILKRKYKLDLKEILEFLDKVSEFLTIIPLDQTDYQNMKELILEHNLKPSDALHVSAMMKTKTRYIISEDRDFDRIGQIKRIWLGHALPDEI